MLHLFRVFFDDYFDAIEIVAESAEEAAEIATLAGMPFRWRDPKEAISRYVVSYPSLEREEVKVA